MADHAYEYEELDEMAPRRLRMHTPAVEDTFEWMNDSEASTTE